MEQTNWKTLWLSNYKGEGDTEDLASFLKKLNYGNRNNISYLPWATVERIFRLQDGKIEILKSERGTIVEGDRVLSKEEVDENGVFINHHTFSFFVNIKVEWQGQTYIEKYPLQDSSGRPLLQWTQNDVNKAIQRGKVKAIAIVSGIGFKLFEDGDLQFEEETTPQLPSNPISKPKITNEPAKVVEPKVQPKPEVKPEPTANRIDLENEIKKQFLSGGKVLSETIRDFLTSKNAKKISDLTDEQVLELTKAIKN